MEKPFAFKVENIEGDEVAIVPSLEKAIAAAKNDLKYGHSPNYITVTGYYEVEAQTYPRRAISILAQFPQLFLQSPVNT